MDDIKDLLFSPSGLYVLQHHTLPNAHSRIIPPTGMTISLDLTLVWGQQTFDSPRQFWRATSDFSIKVC